MVCSKLTIFLIFTFFFFNYSFADQNSYDIVRDFGADADGESDCTQHFLDAWDAACTTKGAASVYVPKGRYLLSKTFFDGKSCKNQKTTITIDGTLEKLASSKQEENWLVFHKVTGLTIISGTLDGQGSSSWDCKSSGGSCKHRATSLGIYNSEDVTIQGLESKNSQKFHMIIHESKNVNLHGTKIFAPEDSPNTDGIHIEKSSAVTILNSDIGTGDDCVSIGSGSSDVLIEGISCGPGHGISIGSLGKSEVEDGVHHVTVKNATLTGTQNGLRIKTWARDSNSFVTNVLYRDITIENSENPILIDQNYCPDHHNNCPHEGSGVKISHITYDNVQGASASEVAVKFDCSKKKPCNWINLDNVQLSYKKNQAKASCDNVYAKMGENIWPSCDH